MMWYSIEPRNRIFVKIYGFLSFAKNMGTHATKVAKNLNNKCSQKLFDLVEPSFQGVNRLKKWFKKMIKKKTNKSIRKITTVK